MGFNSGFKGLTLPFTTLKHIKMWFIISKFSSTGALRDEPNVHTNSYINLLHSSGFSTYHQV